MQIDASNFFDEHKLSNLLESVQEGLWVYDRSLRSYIYFSDSIAKIYGRPESEFAKNLNLWGDVIYKEDFKIFEKASIGLLKHGIVDSKYRINIPDGSIRWVKDKRKLLRDYNHFPRWVVGLVTDITESVLSKEELAESDVSFQILFHENTTPMCIFDKSKYKILEVNSSLIYILGYRYDEFLEKTITDLLHPDDIINFLENNNAEITNREQKKLERNVYRFLSHNGNIKYFGCLNFQSVFHGLDSIITLFFDKTESYLYEERIKKLNKSLEEQNEQLKKIAFMNAHQVRGHLTSIMGLVDLLDQNKLQTEEYIIDLKKAAWDLNSSINKLTETINKGEMIEFSDLELNREFTIMHVDDDSIQLKISELILQKISDEITFLPFSDSEVALENILSHKINPDIIFLDLNMPSLDGWMFIEELNKNEIRCDICIISSTNNPEDIINAKKYTSVKGFLTKPITIEKVKNFIPIKMARD